MQDLLNLRIFSIPTLEIKGDANEESVHDIFVRVNSAGKNLGEDDFILSLFSVYWQEGRKMIEDFCDSARVPKKGTANNFIFQPTPAHIIRVAMCYGFRRARLRYAYKILRGCDLDTGVYSDEYRIENFNHLKIVLDNVQNIQVWKDFIACIESAGYVVSTLISSKNALVYTYAIYLIGKLDCKIDYPPLRKIIAKWFFMATMTGYYTSSPESDMEKDLADLRNIETEYAFISLLESKICTVLTDDYFDITLPSELANSAANNRAWFAYCASLNILDAKVLFSTRHIREAFLPIANGIKNAIEKHHLYPEAYLKMINIKDKRLRNEQGNFAYIEWFDNNRFRDDNPAVYMKECLVNTTSDIKDAYYADHALWDGWENMNYQEFLMKRRVLMANVIKRAFKRLK